MDDLTAAKITLYYNLLLKDPADLTESEAGMGCALACDPDVTKELYRMHELVSNHNELAKKINKSL